jgi:hypothetical protein
MQQNRSLQLRTEGVHGPLGVNANYSYILSSTIRTRWNATRDHLQFYGISPDDVLSELTRRATTRASRGFVKVPHDVTLSSLLQLQPGGRFNVMTGDFAAERHRAARRSRTDGPSPIFSTSPIRWRGRTTSTC